MKKIQVECRVKNLVPNGYIDTLQINSGYKVNDEIAMYKTASGQIHVIDIASGLSVDSTHRTFKSVFEDEEKLIELLHDFKSKNAKSYSQLVQQFEDLKMRCKK